MPDVIGLQNPDVIGPTQRSNLSSDRLAHNHADLIMRRQAEEMRIEGVARRDSIDAATLASSSGERVVRAEQERTEKDAVFDRLNGLLTDFEGVSERDRQRRVEKSYGRGFIGKINAFFAGANIQGGPSVAQEAGRRGLKTVLKTGLFGGVATGAMLGLGILSGAALPVAGIGLAGAAVGRGVVEAIRLIRGKERHERREIEQANEAFLKHMQDYYSETLDLRQELVRENHQDPNYNVEEDPRFVGRIVTLVELMSDDSKRRVRRIMVPDSATGRDKVDYEVVGSDVQGDDVFTIGEKELGLRKHEKAWETGSDLGSMAGGIGASVAAKVLIGQKLAEQAASGAAQAQVNAFNAGNEVGPFDFDKIDGSHSVQKVLDSAYYWVDGKLRDIGSTVQGTADAIYKEVFNAETIRQGAMQTKAILALGGVSLAGAIYRPMVDATLNPVGKLQTESTEQNKQMVAGIKHIFPTREDGSGEGSSNPSGEDGGGEQITEQNEQQTSYKFPEIGSVCVFSGDPEFRQETGLDSFEWGAVRYFMPVKFTDESKQKLLFFALTNNDYKFWRDSQGQPYQVEIDRKVFEDGRDLVKQTDKGVGELGENGGLIYPRPTEKPEISNESGQGGKTKKVENKKQEKETGEPDIFSEATKKGAVWRMREGAEVKAYNLQSKQLETLKEIPNDKVIIESIGKRKKGGYSVVCKYIHEGKEYKYAIYADIFVQSFDPEAIISIDDEAVKAEKKMLFENKFQEQYVPPKKETVNPNALFIEYDGRRIELEPGLSYCDEDDNIYTILSVENHDGDWYIQLDCPIEATGEDTFDGSEPNLQKKLMDFFPEGGHFE